MKKFIEITTTKNDMKILIPIDSILDIRKEAKGTFITLTNSTFFNIPLGILCQESYEDIKKALTEAQL